MQPPRAVKLPLVLPIVGALAAVSVALFIWGLTTPADYFGAGNPALWFTLVAAALGGGYGGTRIRSRWGAAALLALAALGITFWAVAPDGWWASPPNPTQPAR